ncbi:hypothetical protein ACHAPQ_006977 [Fusarium lateritium]
MPGKPSDWDNSEFLMDLTVALYTGAQVNKGLTPAIKESIEEYLKSRGYSTSFDAVRYVFAFLVFSFVFLFFLFPCFILHLGSDSLAVCLQERKFGALWYRLALFHETPSPFTPQPKV